MRKHVLAALALAIAFTAGLDASAQAVDFSIRSGYANDTHASQIAYDSFNNSIKRRLESVRFGNISRGFASAPILRSDDAYAMAPSSRTSSYPSASRRQLDCVYYNGFTVWGDFYQTWASQSTKNGLPGYKYRATAPAVGLDWSSGNFTVGLATTYNWGKLKSKSISHSQNVRTWGLEAYAQYDAELFYVNATAGYGYNRFKGSRFDDNPNIPGFPGQVSHSARYHSNAFNADAEFGMKFNFGGFQLTPHVGVRYFHDRRNKIEESNGVVGYNGYDIQADRKNYHVLELPVGVNVAYVFNMGGALIIPQFRFSWIPELARRRGNVSGTYNAYDPVSGGYQSAAFSANSPKRGRNGFLLGGGIEAKITKSLSAHLDYNCNFRNNAYEHHWNLGVGFTF